MLFPLFLHVKQNLLKRCVALSGFAEDGEFFRGSLLSEF